MAPTPSVFIVEDEAIVAADISETLRGIGYTVTGTAKSGETAIERVGDTVPDLVLMDIHLAGAMDGIDAATYIRSHFGIPVIFLTAYADAALLERAKSAEPYGYIVKPYDERGLHSAIEMAVYKHRMERRLRESEATTRIMVNATLDLLYLISVDGIILVANEALATLAGATPEELAGTSAYDLVGRNILSPKMACWQLDVRGERRIQFEEQYHRNWFDITINPVYTADGKPAEYAVNVRNITARKQAEDLQKNNAEYFRVLIEEASEIVIMLGPDGTFAQESTSLMHALGIPRQEHLKRTVFDHVSISDFQQARQVFSEILIHPGMAKPVRLRFERADGTFCIIKGIMSNQSENPFVGRIVLNGWVE